MRLCPGPKIRIGSVLELLVFWLAAAAMFAMIVLGLLVGPAGASIEDQLDATCRVVQAGTCGTGTCCWIDQRFAYEVTAAHVASKGVVNCEFSRNGYVSKPIKGQVFSADKALDASVIAIPVEHFGGILPRVIPLGKLEDLPGKDTVLTTVGCPSAAFPTGLKVHVLGYEGPDLIFNPTPEHGRSGSALCDEQCKTILGIVTAFRRLGSGPTYGAAVTCATIRSRLFAPMQVVIDAWTPCDEVVHQEPVGVFFNRQGGGGCQNGDCQNGQCEPDNFRLRLQGGNNNEQQNYQQLGNVNPWPPGAAGAPPQQNLDPLIKALGQGFSDQSAALKGLSDTLRSQPTVSAPPCCPATPPATAGPDPQTQQQLQALSSGQQQNAADIKQVAGVVGQLQTDLPKQIDAAVKPVTAAVEAQGKNLRDVSEATQLLQKLHAKLEADAAAGGLKGKAAQGILDMESGEGPGLIHKMGKAEYIVMAVVGFVILCLLIHKHAQKTGNPTPIEKGMDDLKALLQAKALTNPALAPLAAGATAADALLHRVEAKIDAQTAAIATNTQITSQGTQAATVAAANTAAPATK